MKLRICLLLLLTLTFGAINSTYAGFLVKKHMATADSVSATASDNMHTTSARGFKREQRLQTLNTLKQLVIARHEGNRPKDGHHHHSDNSGWEGIVALICGILAFFVGWTFIPAIIFGILGLHKRHHGMAVAGLVLGIIVGVIFLLFLIFVATWFGLFY